MLNNLTKPTGDGGTLQRGPRHMTHRPPPPPYYRHHSLVSAPSNYMYQEDSMLLYTQQGLMPNYGYPSMNHPNMMTSQALRNTLPIHHSPYNSVLYYAPTLHHSHNDYSRNQLSVHCNTGMAIPSREYYLALYEKLILSNPEYRLVPFNDFYQGCILRHAQRQRTLTQEHHLQRQEVCQTEKQLNHATDRTLLGSWYKTPDVVSRQVADKHSGEVNTDRNPPSESANLSQTSRSSYVFIPSAPLLNPPNTPNEVDQFTVDPGVSHKTNTEGINSNNGVTVQNTGNTNTELMPTVISQGTGNAEGSVCSSHTLNSERNKSVLVTESDNHDVEETPLDMSVPKDTSVPKQKMWCLSNSSKKLSSNKSPIKLRFQFRTPSHDEKRSKGNMHMKKKKKKKHSRLSPRSKEGTKERCNDSDSVSSQHSQVTKCLENNKVRKDFNDKKKQQEEWLQASCKEDLNKQSMLTTPDGKSEEASSGVPGLRNLVDDNNNTGGNDGNIAKDSQCEGNGQSDVNETINESFIDQEGTISESVEGSHMNIDEQLGRDVDTVITTQNNDRECTVMKNAAISNTDEITTDKAMSEGSSDDRNIGPSAMEVGQNSECMDQNNASEGKKRRSMQSMQSLFFAKFHAHKLLCLNTGVAQYFVMSELLAFCFSDHRIPNRHGIQAFRHILIAKSRDLNIPFMELTVFRKQVEQYLHAKDLLRDGKHIGIIQISDAHRLYQYFNGMKDCNDDCIVPCEEVTLNAKRLIEVEDTAHNIACLYKTSNTPHGKITIQSEVPESGSNVDNETSERIVRGGIAPLWNGHFRFIIVDSVKYFLFMDLKKFFGEEIIEKSLRDFSDTSTKVKSLSCLPEEALFFNKLEPTLPTVEEGSTVLEEKVIFAAYDRQRDGAANMGYEDRHMSESTHDAVPSNTSQCQGVEGSYPNSLGSDGLLKGREDGMSTNSNISEMDTSEENCTDSLHQNGTTENRMPCSSEEGAENVNKDAANLSSLLPDNDSANNSSSVQEKDLGASDQAVCGTFNIHEMEVPASKMKDTVLKMIESVLTKEVDPSMSDPKDSLMDLICCCQDTCRSYHTKMHSAFLKMVDENNLIKKEMFTLKQNLKAYREGTGLLGTQCQKFTDSVKTLRSIQDEVKAKGLHTE